MSRRLQWGDAFCLSTFFLSTFLLLQCGSEKSSTKAPAFAQEDRQAINRIVLRVGEAEYSEADFNIYVRNEAGTEPESVEFLTRSRLFDEFVEQKLFFRAARDQKITASPEEKKVYLERQAGEAWPEAEQRELLESDSGPLQDKMIVDKYLSEVVKDIKVDQGEIQRYYELHKSEFFLPERVEVSQILLPTEAKAVEVWDKAKLVSAEGFRDLAITESIGPEASEGGVMGIFQKGQLPQEWETIIFSLHEDEVSAVIESSYGFHVFRVDKIYEPEWIPLEKASATIRLNLMDLEVKAAVSRRLEELKESIDWEAFPENLSFPYQRTD